MKAEFPTPEITPPPKSTAPLMTPATRMLPERSTVMEEPASPPVLPACFDHRTSPPPGCTKGFTVTAVVALVRAPELSVTVRVTVKLPWVPKVCVAFDPLADPPSPNVHAYEVIVPSGSDEP